MQLFAECGNRLWLLKMGYDPSFARCSPGQLLLVESVRHAAANGLSTYEFLGVEEPWLRPWGARIRPCLTLRAYPTSMIGRLQRFAARLMA
jgi:CelD/BcsL family acetyltransferase involved in cellulose biosynthesis